MSVLADVHMFRGFPSLRTSAAKVLPAALAGLPLGGPAPHRRDARPQASRAQGVPEELHLLRLHFKYCKYVGVCVP